MRSLVKPAIVLAMLLAAVPASAQTPDYKGEFFSDLTDKVPSKQQVEISRHRQLTRHVQDEPHLVGGDGGVRRHDCAGCRGLDLIAAVAVRQATL